MKNNRKSMGGRAVVAMMFASGLLNAALPAVSEESVLLDDRVILKLSNDFSLSSSSRAYFLLRLAEGYLNDADRTKIDEQFSHETREPTSFRWGRRDPNLSHWEAILIPWVQSLTTRSSQYVAPKENIVLANRAIRDSLKQFDKNSPLDAKLHLYLIALLLSKRTQDAETERTCEEKIQAAITSCEESLDRSKLEATASMLSLKADINFPGALPSVLSSENSEKFRESEKLKLKAIRFLDRLSTDNHARRLAHRDLSRWYSRFDKHDLAEEQKQILFELVGTSDERIMDPRPAGCGHLVWWSLQQNQYSILCGMG